MCRFMAACLVLVITTCSRESPPSAASAPMLVAGRWHVVAIDGKRDAQQWFQQMETRLEKAKTFRLTFDSKAEIDTAPFKGVQLKGSVAVSGTKGRFEMSGEKAGKELFKHLIVCDGTEMVEVEGAQKKRRKAPQAAASNLMTIVARPGFLMMTAPLPPEPFTQPDFDLKQGFGVSGFKLGKTEKISQRETQRLDYTLDVKGNTGTFSVAVWLDVEMGLPVKRQVSLRPGTVWYTETYDIRLDEKLDPKIFELPG